MVQKAPANTPRLLNKIRVTIKGETYNMEKFNSIQTNILKIKKPKML